jgi:hypothetical protein
MKQAFAKLGVVALVIAGAVVIPASGASAERGDGTRPAEAVDFTPAPTDSRSPLLGSLDYDGVADFPVSAFDAPADDIVSVLGGESGYNVVTWDSRGRGEGGGRLELFDDGLFGSQPGNPPQLLGVDLRDPGTYLVSYGLETGFLPPDFLGASGDGLGLTHPSDPNYTAILGFDAPADDTAGNGGNAGLLGSPNSNVDITPAVVDLFNGSPPSVTFDEDFDNLSLGLLGLPNADAPPLGAPQEAPLVVESFDGVIYVIKL